MHDRLVGVVEADVRLVQVLAGERRRERLELLWRSGVVLVGNLDLELRLLRGDVVRFLQVVDTRELEQDLVVAHSLDHGLRNAESVDAAVDHAARAIVVVGDALPGRDLAGVHLEQELGPALEVKAEMGLDLLVHLDRPQVQTDAGAAVRKGERDAVLRDVDEDRQHEDREDKPWERAIHNGKSKGSSRIALRFEPLAGLAHLAIEQRLTFDRRRAPVRLQCRGDRRYGRRWPGRIRGLV